MIFIFNIKKVINSLLNLIKNDDFNSQFMNA